MSVSLQQLQQLIAEFVRDNFPGMTPRRLLIQCHEDPEPLSLPIRGPVAPAVVPPTPPPATPPPASLDTIIERDEPEASAEELPEDSKFSRCITDLLEIFRAARKPLTTMEVLSALDQANKQWSPRTVSHYLRAMVEDGILENPKGARPPGYRLNTYASDES